MCRLVPPLVESELLQARSAAVCFAHDPKKPASFWDYALGQKDGSGGDHATAGTA